MERNDDADDDGDDGGQNAGKRCQARIILEWKGACRGMEGERERVPPRRRQPFTRKSSTSFLHTPSLPAVLFITPWFFVPPPVRRLSSTNLFFLLSFPHPFLAACTFSQYGARGRGWGGAGSKQRNVRRGDFNTLLHESARQPKVAFINLFRVYVNSYAQPVNLHRVHFQRTSHFPRVRGAIGELRPVNVMLINFIIKHY